MFGAGLGYAGYAPGYAAGYGYAGYGSGYGYAAAAPVVATGYAGYAPAYAGAYGYAGPLNLNTQLIAHPNGAVVPLDEPAVAAARAAHLDTQAAEYAASASVIAAPVVAVGYGYAGPLNLNTHLVAHPNGAVVPVDEPTVASNGGGPVGVDQLFRDSTSDSRLSAQPTLPSLQDMLDLSRADCAERYKRPAPSSSPSHDQSMDSPSCKRSRMN